MTFPSDLFLKRNPPWPLVMAFFFTSRFLVAEPSLDTVFDPIRAQYNLPALAGAIFTTDGVVEMAAVGVRKAGTTIPVTTNDLWQLGSDTKMMTAALAGTYVIEKKLSWDDKVISFFPELERTRSRLRSGISPSPRCFRIKRASLKIYLFGVASSSAAHPAGNGRWRSRLFWNRPPTPRELSIMPITTTS